jgi:UDP-N-acetylmuramoylalanine--D-glutamate ligase
MVHEIDGKRVLVLGFARQGKALARWLPTQGASVTVSDKRNMGDIADDLLEFLGEEITWALGGHPLDLLQHTDLLCLSGSVPTDIPIVQAALQNGIPVINDAVLFLERCPALVLGITGSAGKTTTTSLVGRMCEADGRKTWVGGNIGHVLLEDLEKITPQDTVVMELSSFQLEISPLSPDIAAVLNITPNHLDRHGTLQNYAAAKANIFAHQQGDDWAVLGIDDLITNAFTQVAPAQVASFSARQMVSHGAFLLGDRLVVTGAASPDGGAKVVCERQEINLRGDHNILNVLAAMAIAGLAGVSVQAMRHAILEFRGVEHRLEVVADIGGAKWINDSIATAPERVVAALRSFQEPIILLAGGRDKDLPWAEMLALAAEKCKAVIAFGEHGPAIGELANLARRRSRGGHLGLVKVVKTLEAAVRVAARLAEEGDVVLLSPGGTSYDAYQDFAERGEHFRKLVGELKNQSRPI